MCPLERELFSTASSCGWPKKHFCEALVFSTEKGKAAYVPIPEDQDEAKAICQEFKDLLESDDKLWVGQNIKYDAIIMKWKHPSPLAQNGPDEEKFINKLYG